MKVLLPNSLAVSPRLPRVMTAVQYDIEKPIPARHADAEAIIVWGNSSERINSMPKELPKLRWMQGLMAGSDAMLSAGLSDRTLITSGRTLHDGPVAEHALALTLAAARRLDRAFLAQQERRWAPELGGLQPMDNSTGFTTLRNAEVLIFGFGSIGQRLAPMLAALGARVTGVARSSGARNGFDVVAIDEARDRLPTTDVLISLLPSSPDTNNLVNAELIDKLPTRAWIINVGRGSTLDEAALIEALHEGSIGGAALDVAVREPLPSSSPLWDAPNLILTPHAAGGRPLDAEGLIERNARAFAEGLPLENVVVSPVRTLD